MTDHEDMRLLLEKLAEEQGVVNVLLVSGDGRPLAHASSLPQDGVERTSAVLSGITSLSTSLSEFCDCKDLAWRMTVTCLREKDKDWSVLMIGAGENAALGVSVAAEFISPIFAVASQATITAVSKLRGRLSVAGRTS